jgi:hypothetical protein
VWPTGMPHGCLLPLVAMAFVTTLKEWRCALTTAI